MKKPDPIPLTPTPGSDWNYPDDVPPIMPEMPPESWSM
jgi:hypothetical protein